MNTDLTFFTNEEGSTLLDRFKITLKNNTQFFDVLVGYFRTSGFFHLYKSLEKVEKIRILVGINLDKQAHDLVEQVKNKQLTLKFSHKETQKVFADQVTQEMESSEDNYNVEEGVLKFIEFIQNGKLEIKAYPTQTIHAKVYIIRKDTAKSEDYGRVITGSSNFSYSGLHENLEFNVELKDSRDVKYALERFEALWKDSVDISSKYIETINQRTWLNDAIVPYELYLKFLYEYFKEKINEDMDTIYKDRRFLPEGFMELEYQDEAVKDAMAKLGDYGGVFLADVVGLGKTYMSALLAQQLDGYTLVICPPVLKDYWHDTFRDFGVRGFDVESLGKIGKLVDNAEKYRNVFIDEAHRFRNETTQTYEQLKQVCWGKRVILVSATPLNNTLKDILSQIKLFQKGHNSTIPNVRDLDKFFNELMKKQKAVDRKNLDEYIAVVKKNSKKIREHILKYLMVRRTRTEVLKYFPKDLKQRNLKFPNLAEPRRVYYEFNGKLERIFLQTIKLIRKFRYTRYMPLVYLKNPSPEEKQELIGQRNMGRFMKILLVKRLESSFFAFKKTLGRFENSYHDFVNMLNNGRVYIDKKYNDKIQDSLRNDDQEMLDSLVKEKGIPNYETKDFTDELKKDLEADIAILKEIIALWNSVDIDPKIEKFKEMLQSDKVLKGNKIIIFTESKETADYLKTNLMSKYGDKVFVFSGHSSVDFKQRVIENYDPNCSKHKDDINILVTTDVLAEGMNLHRSNVVINYDIPWNPTRVLQRVGRINRIGTIHNNIYVYNFFPTIQANNEIKLEEAAIAKIQAFHDTLGEDSQYLTEGEEITTHELFSRINSKNALEKGGEEEENSELEYLSEIRDIRDKKPELYECIKRLPKKARTAKLSVSKGVVTFFRKGKLRKIFKSAEGKVFELDFFAAAEQIKCKSGEKRQKIQKDFYPAMEANKEAFRSATIEDVREFKQSGGRSNETTLIRTIKAIQKFPKLTEDDEEYLAHVLKLLQDGALSRQITKVLIKDIKRETNPLKILFKFKHGIPESYFTTSLKGDRFYGNSPREVILSEYLVKGNEE